VKINIAILFIFSLIAASAFASHVYVVGFMALALACVAIFINSNYNVTVVKAFVDRWF
jgi:hypothetical protein